MVIKDSLKGVDVVKMTIEYISPSGERYRSVDQLKRCLRSSFTLSIDNFSLTKKPLYYGPPSEFVSVAMPGHHRFRFCKPRTKHIDWAPSNFLFFLARARDLGWVQERTMVYRSPTGEQYRTEKEIADYIAANPSNPPITIDNFRLPRTRGRPRPMQWPPLPNVSSPELLQKLAVNNIVFFNTRLLAVTGLNLDKYKVLRRKFVAINAVFIVDWPERQTDQVIIAAFLFCRKGQQYVDIGRALRVPTALAAIFVANGLTLLHLTYPPLNGVNLQRFLENEEGFFCQDKNKMQGFAALIDYTPVILLIGRKQFILFLAVNEQLQLEDIELQHLYGGLSEEDYFRQTIFFNSFLALPQIKIKCRLNHCLHTDNNSAVFGLSVGGDKKFDKTDDISLNLAPTFGNAFAHDLDVNNCKVIQKSHHFFNAKFNKFRFPIERVCGMIKQYNFFSMELDEDVDFKFVSTVIGQMYNASRGHFYLDDDHLCALGCRDFRRMVIVQIISDGASYPLGVSYLNEVHMCLIDQCVDSEEDTKFKIDIDSTKIRRKLCRQ